jgi:hypothetical protein
MNRVASVNKHVLEEHLEMSVKTVRIKLIVLPLSYVILSNMQELWRWSNLHYLPVRKFFTSFLQKL